MTEAVNAFASKFKDAWALFFIGGHAIYAAGDN